MLFCNQQKKSPVHKYWVKVHFNKYFSVFLMTFPVSSCCLQSVFSLSLQCMLGLFSTLSIHSRTMAFARTRCNLLPTGWFRPSCLRMWKTEGKTGAVLLSFLWAFCVFSYVVFQALTFIYSSAVVFRSHRLRRVTAVSL